MRSKNYVARKAKIERLTIWNKGVHNLLINTYTFHLVLLYFDAALAHQIQ